MSFGENIKKLRKSRNLTQEQLAKKCGVTRGAIARYESGEMEAKTRTAMQLTKVLGCTLDDLFRE